MNSFFSGMDSWTLLKPSPKQVGFIDHIKTNILVNIMLIRLVLLVLILPITDRNKSYRGPIIRPRAKD